MRARLSIASEKAALQDSLEQAFQRTRRSAGHDTGLLFAAFESDQDGAARDLELLPNRRARELVPIDANDFDFTILGVLVDERTHGAFLGSTSTSPRGVEIEDEWLAAGKRSLINFS